MILLELAWLGFLDIIWLAASAYTSSIFPPLGALCSENSNISNLVSACGDTQASMAFSWIIWLIRMSIVAIPYPDWHLPML